MVWPQTPVEVWKVSSDDDAMMLRGRIIILSDRSATVYGYILRPFSPPDAFYVRTKGCDAFLAKDQRVERSDESIKHFWTPLSESPDGDLEVVHSWSERFSRE